MSEPTSPGLGSLGADAVDELICSARGCRAEAAWGLLWNNPRLHAPERRKVWLACDDHRAHLEQFLGARAFLRSTVPVAELDRRPVPPPPGGVDR
ncbi:hypothetical protein [Cellulomonas fimi]|uniref:Acetone carboxylase n=1 Tax=Cellulomonas fimi TaxID=1708 RepID=A0A7Y0LZG8_CELFI|nr:hypothetical protein [Cellulomonas fimi]NMR20766.1 hypothetical protein [Cellulomonas fimi]